jgi:Tfp pilus assembly protein PilV
VTGLAAHAPAGGPRPAGGQAGFTLAEVLVSSVILMLAIVSVISVMSHASLYVADLRLRTRSTQISSSNGWKSCGC